MMARMPELKVVQTLNSGYDDILPHLPAGVALANGRGLRDTSASEHALALILAVQRDVPRWVRQQDRAVWGRRFPASLAGRRVLIVGYGSIGAALERRVVACEAEVVRVGRRARPADGIEGVDQLRSLLPEADIVVLTVPLTADTRGLIGAAELALMRDGALLVNISRGPVVDTAALLAEGGRIRAALDVTDPEPLPDNHPLWSLPNVLISPHVGGGGTPMYPRIIREFVREQLRRFVSGENLLNVVAGPKSIAEVCRQRTS
jgi:phosphoglycerate dehydrogenase-like enzyme